MKIPPSWTYRVSEEVKSALASDIVSRGELCQIVEDCALEGSEIALSLDHILYALLQDDVQIGCTRKAGDRVKFIAWKGQIDERVRRARREAELSSERDRNFAYWLCFTAKVDEYEA